MYILRSEDIFGRTVVLCNVRGRMCFLKRCYSSGVRFTTQTCSLCNVSVVSVNQSVSTETITEYTTNEQKKRKNTISHSTVTLPKKNYLYLEGVIPLCGKIIYLL